MYHTPYIRSIAAGIATLLLVASFLSPVVFSLSVSTDGGPQILLSDAVAHAQAAKTDSSGGPMEAMSTVGMYIGNLILSTAAAFTAVGGYVLDIALERVVFGMGGLVNDPEFGNAIDTTWRIIRDICNLGFIFGFIYVGIRTIIDPESASTKRFLSRIIIGALLINFSIFFVKFIVDFTNLTAYHIYTAMTSGTGTLSAKLADMLGIVTIFSSPNPANFAHITSSGMVWFYILGALLLFIAAFVFFAAGILLAVRFVTLILIMVASPILFVAPIFPQTEHYAATLWRLLLSNAFFAPLYLLITLVSITLLGGLVGEFVGTGSTFANTLSQRTATVDSYGIMLNFIVIIFFLIQSLLVAKKLGAAGGSMAISWGNNLRSRGQQFIGGGTAGLAARGMRATAGRAAYSLSENDKLKDVASRRGIGGWAARQGLKTSRTLSDASFDARNVAGAGKALGIGEGRKGGYATVKKEIEDSEMKFAKSLGEVGDDDVRVEARKKEMEVAQRNLRMNREQLQNDLRSDNETTRRTALANLEKLEKAERTATENYGNEKQRRVLGSTFVSEETRMKAAAQKVEVEKVQKEIKDRWEAYLNLDEAQKDAQRPIIEGLKKGLADEEKKYKEILTSEDGGYAAVLEGSTKYTAWPQGRTVRIERETGEAMRKATEKKVKKSKEDTRYEELINATKASTT